MDDVERDLRATFDRLADCAVPSTELVERTVERTDQIKRRRRAAIASGLATVAIIASVTAASIAGAGTHSSHLHVAGPTGGGFSPDTTTTASTTATTVVLLPPPGTTHHYTVPPPRPSATTTVPACDASWTLGDAVDLTLSADGSVQASFFLVSGPAHEVHHYVLDDGTAGEDGLTQVYAPDQFGPHSYDEWGDDGGHRSCTEHHTFDVEPSAVTTTTTPGDTTTTSMPSDTTTLPTGTSIPPTSTTIGH